MGLFEQIKHVASEIAEENLRRLSGDGRLPRQDDAVSRQRLLGFEQLRRELVLNRQEYEGRERLARSRQGEHAREAERWRHNAAFALARDNDELSAQATERALAHEREAALAKKEAQSLGLHIARLSSEIVNVDRKIEAERALRQGATPPPALGPGHSLPPATRALGPLPDPLEAAFERLRREDDRSGQGGAKTA